MTYWEFHLIFNLPVFLLLVILLRNRFTRGRLLWITALCAIAFVATTPWDNWAVYKGIWGFDWDRATPVEITLFDTLWRLPAEEYAFFLIMTILVCLTCFFFLPRPQKS